MHYIWAGSSTGDGDDDNDDNDDKKVRTPMTLELYLKKDYNRRLVYKLRIV
jgi:hypothetical protein